MNLEEMKSPDGGNRQGFESANTHTNGSKPMTSLALNTNFVKTMSSRQIAEVVDKRHDNVKRTIETLAKQGVIQLPQIEEVKNHLGQAVQEYMVNERDSYIVVAQLCPEYTAKLVDYWMATKNSLPALPNFTDPAEAAIAWAAEFKAKQFAQVQIVKLEAENQTMKVDVKALEQISKASGSLCLTDAAKALGMTRDKFIKWLSMNDWIFKRHGNAHWLGYSDKEKAGYVEHKVEEVTRGDGTTKIVEQVRITPKGLAKLAKIFAKGEAA